MLVTPLSEKQASSAIVGAVKKELMAEVKEELRELLARHANDQVADAVLEHNSASSLLPCFTCFTSTRVLVLLALKYFPQVAEAVLEHKSASSLLTWFDSGKGKPNDERMETAVKSVLAKLYRHLSY